MLPVILGNNNGVQLAQNTVGLGGFWGRLAKKLIAMAVSAIKDIPIVGGIIGNEIETRLNQWTGNYGAQGQSSSFWNRGGADYEPTPAEEAIIQDWHTAKFLPFYKTMVAELDAGLKLASIPQQIAAINVAMAKMMVGRDWHKANAKNGLSAAAIDWREEYMQSAFKPLFDIIMDTLLPYEFDETAMWLPDHRYVNSETLTNINYSPLISGVPAGLLATQYFIRGLAPNSPMVPGYVPPTTPPVLPPATTTPVTPPTLPPATTTPLTPTPSTPVVTNPTNPTVPAKADKEKSFLQKYKIPLLAAGVIAIFWPEE